MASSDPWFAVFLPQRHFVLYSNLYCTVWSHVAFHVAPSAPGERMRTRFDGACGRTWRERGTGLELATRVMWRECAPRSRALCTNWVAKGRGAFGSDSNTGGAVRLRARKKGSHLRLQRASDAMSMHDRQTDPSCAVRYFVYCISAVALDRRDYCNGCVGQNGLELSSRRVQGLPSTSADLQCWRMHCRFLMQRAPLVCVARSWCGLQRM